MTAKAAAPGNPADAAVPTNTTTIIIITDNMKPHPPRPGPS